MTGERSISDRLAARIVALLDGEGLAGKSTLVFELLTVDAEGWPHVALLSVGEVMAVDDRQVMLALWPGTTTSGNLRRDGRAVLEVIDEGSSHKVRLTCREIDDQAARAAHQAVFRATVERVARDAVNYATLTSGPIIRLVDEAATVRHWRASVTLMRELASKQGQG